MLKEADIDPMYGLYHAGGFPCCSVVKNSPATRGTNSILGWEDSLEENGIALQDRSSCRKAMNRGAWWTTIHRLWGHKESGRDTV